MLQTALTMPLMDAIDRRRSVRSYSEERIDETTIQQLLTATVRAPTAVHEEMWSFVIIQDSGLLKRLSDRAKPLFAEEAHRAHRDPGGHALDLFASPDFKHLLRRQHTDRYLRPTARAIRRGGLLAGDREPAAHGLCARSGHMRDRLSRARAERGGDQGRVGDTGGRHRDRADHRRRAARRDASDDAQSTGNPRLEARTRGHMIHIRSAHKVL